MESEDGGGEFISRPRFIALNEFGPRNVIYHDGAKYRVDRMILTEAELKLENGKICPKTGYFLYDKQYGYEVDPIINETLQLDTKKHVHTMLIEMAETRAYELQRITCQEEERTKKGYDIQTYFAVDGGFENTTEGIVSVANEKLLHIHYLPTCRIFKLNLKWRASKEYGFTINLNTGYWQSKKNKEDNGEKDEIKDVKLFTSDTANALYIQPIKSLGLEGGGNGVITLMFAIKRAIENYFQVESNEIGATIMGEEDAPNILIYESAEGSLGVLSQIMDNPSLYKAIMTEAYKVCFYKNEVEEEGEVLPATYDDLLSYYNQFYHQQIDRNLIRGGLRNLTESTVEVLANKSFSSYDEQYQFLQSARDPNSSTEDKFLKYLYQNNLKLPDEAQPKVANMYVRPDFYYKPNVMIFCDGTPHDENLVQEDDSEKRAALKNAGYQVLAWYYKDSLEDFVAKRPDLFKKVK
jgi:very-short-patch-repair endonuclease